jgi:hypothetical protein
MPVIGGSNVFDLTNSKFVFIPLICAIYGTTGLLSGGRLIEYSSVLTPISS